MRGLGACAHGLPLGECTSPGCPIWLADPRGRKPWVTGWAISRYSGGGPHDTRLGSLVHDIKYGQTPLDLRQAMADEIAERMMGFISEVCESPRLPFSVCLAPPSHQPKPFELAHYLSQEVAAGFGLIDASSRLHERRPVRSMKEIPDAEQRRAILNEAITVDRPTSGRSPRGFLVVDDVFESGATMGATCEALRRVFPRSQFHVLAATCRY